MKGVLCTCRHTVQQKRNSQAYFNLNLVLLWALASVYCGSHSSIRENLRLALKYCEGKKKEITHFWLSSEHCIIWKFMNYYGNIKAEKGNTNQSS